MEHKEEEDKNNENELSSQNQDFDIKNPHCRDDIEGNSIVVNAGRFNQNLDSNNVEYSEGYITSFDNTNREKELLSSTAYDPLDKTCAEITPPSQYPLSDLDNDTDRESDYCRGQNSIESGLPEKYFSITAKDDVLNEDGQYYILLEQDDSLPELKEQNTDELFDDKQCSQELVLQNLSNVSLNQNENSNFNKSYKYAGSSTEHDPNKISAFNKTPHFYWKITQQRKEPMGSENTDSVGFNKATLTVNASNVSNEKNKENGEEQVSCTFLDITVSPATSVNVYSDSETVNADFRLIRPPLVGQSSDFCMNNILSGDINKQNYISNSESTSNSSTTSHSSDDEPIHEKKLVKRDNDTNSLILGKNHNSQKYFCDKSYVKKENKNPNIPNITTYIKLNANAVPKDRNNIQNDEVSGDFKGDTLTSPTVSEPSSLEYFQDVTYQKSLLSTSIKDDEKYMHLKNRYFLSSAQTEQISSLEYKSRHQSTDSNDLDSERSGYQSDNRVLSPTSISSLSSNRKLEWDNGADIGYNAVISAAMNELANTYRSEPEGIPTHRDNLKTIRTSTQQISSKREKTIKIKDNKSTSSNSEILDSEKNLSHSSNENLFVNQLQKEQINKIRSISEKQNQHTAAIQTDLGDITRDAEVQAQISSRSLGSHSSPDSLSSSSTVKLVNKIGAVDDTERRSSLSSPLSEPIVSSYSSIMHLDKSLLKSKSDSSTLDISSVTVCLQESQSSSTDPVGNFNCQVKISSKEYENEPKSDSFSPEIEYSSADDSEDINEKNKCELPQLLLKTDRNFGQELPENLLPGSLLFRGIKFSNKSEYSSKSNLSKSLSNLCNNSKGTSSSLPMLLPETILPPNVTDMSSLRMYLEERYQNEIPKDQTSSTSQDENILIVNASYEEEDLNASLVVDGPRIRWYPVTGSELPQDIRDAATQTAVSYLTQHTPQQTLGTNSIGMTNINYPVISSELLVKRPITIPSSLNGNFIESFTTSQRQNTTLGIKTNSDINENNYLLKNEDTQDEEIKNFKNVPMQHNFSKDGLKVFSQDIFNNNNNIEERKSNQESLILSEDIKSKCRDSTSYSDSEMCDDKSIKSTKTYTLPVHLPPLSKSSPDKLITTQHMKISSENNASILKSASDTNSLLAFGTNLPSGIEVQSSTLKSFPKLDKTNYFNHVYNDQKDSSKMPQGNGCFIHKKSIFTKVSPITKSVVMPVNMNIHYRKDKVNNSLCDLEENDQNQEKIIKFKNYKRTISSNSNTHIMRTTSDEASAQPGSSTEYSNYWKVVTENNSNSAVNESSTPSTSYSDRYRTNSALTSEEKLVNGFAPRTTEALALDENIVRPKTKSLMVEIKNILSKRNISSNLIQKYAISNDSGKNLEVHYDIMPSIHSETTMESTHTGSDDAEPPNFPPHAYGSRLNVEVLSPGIYGSKKYLEKYGKSVIQDKIIKSGRFTPVERETIEKSTINPSINYSSDTSKEASFSFNQHAPLDTTNDSKYMTNLKEKHNKKTEECINTPNFACHRIQGVGQELSSSSIQGQTSSTQEQTSSTNINLSLENSSLSTERKSNGEISKTDSSETNDTQLINRVVSADFGISNLKPSQLAKRELEKLRHLVNKQKRSYIRRLQREVHRLEKFEEVFLSESLKHLSTSSHTSTTNGTSVDKIDKLTKRNGLNVKNGYCSVHNSSLSVTDSALSSSNNKDLTVPKTKTRKIYTRKFVNTSVNTSQTIEQNQNSKQDFCQNFPTPLPSSYDKNLRVETISIGIQTSDIKPNGRKRVDSKLGERCFITLDSSPNGPKKLDKKTHRHKEKVYLRKRKGNIQTVPKYLHQNIAWFVPLSSAKRRKQLINSGVNPPVVSLQEAFHRNCGHIIKHSQSRLMKIAKLADIRQKQTALALEKAQLTSELNSIHRIEPRLKIEEKVKPLTHEEMREQTEKIYKKLPEVVEKKEKKKRDQQYKTNRLMAQIYNKKLQEQVLKGKVSWTITQSCLDCNS